MFILSRPQWFNNTMIDSILVYRICATKSMYFSLHPSIHRLLFFFMVCLVVGANASFGWSFQSIYDAKNDGVADSADMNLDGKVAMFLYLLNTFFKEFAKWTHNDTQHQSSAHTNTSPINCGGCSWSMHNNNIVSSDASWWPHQLLVCKGFLQKAYFSYSDCSFYTRYVYINRLNYPARMFGR